MVYSDLSYAVKRLQDTLGADRVSQDEMEKLVYGHDFALLPKQAAFQFTLKPDILVLPKSTQEVVRVLRLARELDFPVVVRGGGTSLHGGSVPNMGGILMALTLMREVVRVDKDHESLTIQAGATWRDAMEAAAAEGLFLPVAPLFFRSSTIGGHVSNGGVGIGAYKYGGAAEWVRSLEVVLPSGETLETGERGFDLHELNYNLTRLFAGAEGTLGVVTQATLRLLPAPETVEAVAYRFEGFQALVQGLRELARTPVTPYHVAFYDEGHLLLNREVRGRQQGVPARPVLPEELADLPAVPGLALVAFEGSRDQVAAEKQAVEKVLSPAGGMKLEDAVAQALWDARWEPYRARRLSGGLVVAEGLVPLTRLQEAKERAAKLARRLRMEAAFHGFLTDPDSAFLVPYILTDERTLRGQLAISFVERYHELLLELGGHPLGLGLLTTYNLEPMFGPAVAAHMRRLKQALDPDNFLNKGKLVATMGKQPPFYPFGEREVPARLMRRGLRLLGTLRSLLPPQRYVSRVRRRS